MPGLVLQGALPGWAAVVAAACALDAASIAGGSRNRVRRSRRSRADIDDYGRPVARLDLVLIVLPRGVRQLGRVLVRRPAIGVLGRYRCRFAK